MRFRDLVTERARQLLLVAGKVKQLIGHVDITAGRSEGIRLRVVDEQDPNWVLVARLRHTHDVTTDRPEQIIQGR